MFKKATVQFLFWAIFFFFWYQIVYIYVDNISNRLLFTLLDVLLLLISFYFVYYFAAPKLLLKKRLVLFSLSIIGGVLLSSFLLIMALKFILNSSLFHIQFYMSWSYSDMYNNRFFIAGLGTIAGVITKLSFEWVKTKKRLQMIELERVKTELGYLKNQINPHFLFNALNTIYFQLDESKAIAQGSLIKFSDILRYQLYDGSSDFVPIVKEIEYLNNYIEIQRLRKETNFKITFDYTKEWNGKEVAPLLLITFIENAFKHVSHCNESENLIEISLMKVTEGLLFTCINSIAGSTQKVQSGQGLGLANVKRMLELIYPRRYGLRIEKDKSFFRVHLKINI